MARLRTLKPDFFLDEDLAELSFAARLLYQSLWTQADRDGRLEDRPKRIKAQAFPYDDVDIETLLDDLFHAGFIVRYAANDKRYIAIPNFLKHQTPHIRETSKGIPAPPVSGACMEGAQDMHHASPVLAPDEHHTSPSPIGVLGIGVLGIGSGLLEADSDAADAAQPNPNGKQPDPKRGCRIPENWEPSDADYAQMVSEFPELTRSQLAAALPEFRDYWLSVAGAKGVKLRWGATWRNDIRHKHANGYFVRNCATRTADLPINDPAAIRAEHLSRIERTRTADNPKAFLRALLLARQAGIPLTPEDANTLDAVLAGKAASR